MKSEINSTPGRLPGDSATGDPGTVTVLSRGLVLIKAFVPDNEWRSNQDLALACALPKATVSRLAISLTELGMFECSSHTGMYRLSPQALTLGYSGFVAASPWAPARSEMRRFADEYGAVVVVAERVKLSMVCVEACQSELGILSFRITHGTRLKLPFSATGRAYYGAASSREQLEILSASLATFPGRKAEIEAGLADARDQMQRNSCYVSISTLQRGINGLGAVVPRRHSGGIQYVVGCAAPMNVFTEKNLIADVWPRFRQVVSAVETCVRLRNEEAV